MPALDRKSLRILGADKGLIGVRIRGVQYWYRPKPACDLDLTELLRRVRRIYEHSPGKALVFLKRQTRLALKLMVCQMALPCLDVPMPERRRKAG